MKKSYFPDDISEVLDTAGTIAVSQAALYPPLDPPTPECPFVLPVKKIHFQADLMQFRETQTFRVIVNFIHHMSDAVIGISAHDPRASLETASPAAKAAHRFIQEIRGILDKTDAQETSQRFGNRAFRTFHSRMVASVPKLLEDLLTSVFMTDDKGEKVSERLAHAAAVEMSPYVCDSFGNAFRIDYGTGHELHFVAFLFCLYSCRILHEEDNVHTVLLIFKSYLELCRSIQQKYKLEPAGSHGVWSLDDFQFIPYIWGSAQLINHPTITPSSVLDPEIVKKYADEYLYLGCIAYTLSVKTGPFHEHSPDLYNISAAASWQKINSGMFRKYDADVLSKWPIMQHFLFGSLIPCLWDAQVDFITEVTSPHSKIIAP